jgi:hypothetical protein
MSVPAAAKKASELDRQLLSVTGGEKGSFTVNFKPSDPQLVAAVQDLMKKNGWSQKDIGKRVGPITRRAKAYTNGYVSTWLSGKWTGDDWEDGVRRFLNNLTAEARARRDDEFWLDNDISDLVLDELDKAFTRGTVVALTGDAGIGKTYALRRFGHDAEKVIIPIQCSPVCRTAPQLTRAMFDVITEEYYDYRGRNAQDAIVQFMLRWRPFIVFDDYDLLAESGYDFILRGLWNQTRNANCSVGFAMFGNARGMDNIRRLPPQLVSRLKHIELRVSRNTFAPDFTRAMLAQHLPGVKLTASMRDLAHSILRFHPAHMRTLVSLCEWTLDSIEDGVEPELAFHANWLQSTAYTKCGSPTILAALTPKLTGALHSNVTEIVRDAMPEPIEVAAELATVSA